MRDGWRRIVGRCADWLNGKRVPLFGLVVLVWWVYPLMHPLGRYAGCYRVVDLEVGVFAALLWLVCALVAAAPEARRRALGIRLGVSLSALLVTAAACDLGAVLWQVYGTHFWYYGQGFDHNSHEHDPELVWKFRPGFGYQGRANPFSHEIQFATDEHGFRNPRGMTQADIVFVGDSVTMAAEVPAEASFVQKTAQALGVRAVNLGVYGYGPQQELAVLKRYGLAYHPRVVVWQVTEWNDCEDAERYARRKHPEKPQLKPWSELYQAYSPLAAGLGKLFTYHGTRYDGVLTLVRHQDGLVDLQYLWPVTDAVARSPQGWEATRQMIAEARALCRANGIGFVVLFVPTHTRVLAPYVVPRNPEERDRFAPHSGATPGPLAQALAELCRQLDCPLIDLFAHLRRRAEVDNHQLYIKHDPHLDLAGHDVATQALVQSMGKDFTTEHTEIAERKTEKPMK